MSGGGGTAAWIPAGLGLDDEWRGMVFAPAAPECHEHCDGCMGTGCPDPAHRRDWIVGYRASEEATEFWLCPLCFDLGRARFDLRLDPAAPFPRVPIPEAR